MTFDVSTLTFAGSVVSLASGLTLFMNWWQDRMAWPAFWWGVASFGLGLGIGMLALHDVLPTFASNIVGPAIISVSATFAWVAARIFNRGAISPYLVLAILVCGMGIVVLTGAYASQQLSGAVAAGISGCLYAAAAIEFWLTRGEKLRGRWPMISVLSLEATALFLTAIDLSFFTLASQLPSLGWFGVIYFVGLVYAGGSAMFLVMMLNERSEAKERAAALVDPLTGLANRRAFMERAQRLLERSDRDETPLSLLGFDLDRFKEINDAFGHPTGDQVLRIFADVLLRTMRPADIAGRVGGEEFAAALPGCTIQAAAAIAGRIRGAFQEDARFVGGQRISATVSVGVATAAGRTCSLAEIIANADSALYRAKNLGRNRVVVAEGKFDDPDPPVIARIA
jgi:diguanylate cyclase (GGDEF)-like protein